MVEVITKDIMNDLRLANKSIAFVFGIFNVLHVGHIRLMEFAKSKADILVVGLLPDGTSASVVSFNERMEGVMSCRYVDYVISITQSIEDIIDEYRPDIIVKGFEHKDKQNQEEVIVKYGGKLIFTSGEIDSVPIDVIEQQYSSFNKKVHDKAYLKRHNITKNTLSDMLGKIKQQKVLVIGDIIIDQYVDCTAIGLSKEDASIAVMPKLSNNFLGAAGIVAAHCSQIAQKTYFVSIRGDDVAGSFAIERLDQYPIQHKILISDEHKTTTKKRYRVDGKTLLRVNDYSKQLISQSMETKILKEIESIIDDVNVIIFSDFNYGVLTQSLVYTVTEMALKHNITICADSQASSQLSDISRFKNATLITPTEHEIRLALQDDYSSLTVLSEKLRQKSNVKYVVVTLGALGAFINLEQEHPSEIFCDQLHAINTAPLDVSGAGDCLLVFSSLALAAGCDIWQSAYLGNVAASIKVGNIGNKPIHINDILLEIENI